MSVLRCQCRTQYLRRTDNLMGAKKRREENQCTGRPTAPIITRYRCFLPDLAGLAGLRRVGPGTGTILSLNTLSSQNRPTCIRAKLASPSSTTNLESYL